MSDDVILTAAQVADTRAAAMNVYHEAPDPFMRGMLAILDSHEALRARLAEVERERDEWRTEAQHWSSRPQEEAARARAAEARVKELTEALRKYGEHDYECDYLMLDEGECDCGFDAVLAVLGEQEAAPPGNPDPQFMVDGYDMTPPGPLTDARSVDEALAFIAASPGEPERCPTCRSDDPGVCTKGYAHRIVNPGMCCSDPWHGEQKGGPS